MTSRDEQPELPDDAAASSADNQSSADSQPSSARFWLRVALPIVVFIVVVAGIFYVATGGTSHQGATTTPPTLPGTSASPGSAVTPTPTSHGPSATRTSSGQADGVPAGGLTGSAALTKLGSDALPLPKKLEARVAGWDSGRGGAALAALSGQFGNVLQAAGIKEYVPMKHECGQLTAETAAARAAPPIPDAAMQRLYAKALADFTQGAADCKASISQQPSGDETINTNVDPAQLHRSLSLIGAGGTDLYRATAEIEALKHG